MKTQHHILLRSLFPTMLFLTGTCILILPPSASADTTQYDNSVSAKVVKETVVKKGTYFTIKKMQFTDGTSLNKMIISGPPTPPNNTEISRETVTLPTAQKEAGINTLTVPAYTWVYGCSAVSAAMIAGYYDRHGFSNIYTGPSHNGVIPLTDSWGTWTDSASESYPNNPLVASHNGIDGRTSMGSIGDYWVSYDSTTDPYISGGWTQHSWGDAIGDYMKTSQSAYDNADGATSIYYSSSADALTCSALKEYDNYYGTDYADTDGNYGRKLFYQARGYTVTDCYTQLTDNYISGGFSFSQFKAEIDAGRPVMINLEGHTVVGVGYNDDSNLIYIHDTWDNSTHSMTWGGSYSDMAMWSVSVVNLSGTITSSASQLPIGAVNLLLEEKN